MPDLTLNIPSLEEFAASNPNLPEKETDSTPDIPSLEEFAKTYSPTKKTAKPTNPDKIVFQPANVDWSLAKLNSIQEFYKGAFNQDLPLSNVGQGEIQNKFHFDHRGSADVGLNPDSQEGQRLISYLKENNIPFLAFKKAIPGVSTGPHIHIGKPSKHTDTTYYVGQTLDNVPQDPETNLDSVPSLEEFAQSKQEEEKIPSIEEFAQSPELKKQRQQTAPLEIVDLTFATDPNKLDFKVHEKQSPEVLDWFTKYNKPVITGQNPYQVGEMLQTDFEYDQKPDTNTAIDYLLQKWNPEYADLNAQFRAETGGLNILNVQNQEGFIESLGDNKYRVKARPTRGAMALLEAYKNGGLPAYNTTLMLINQQKQDVLAKNRLDNTLIEEYRNQHPYISAFESAFEREAESSTQLAQNLKYLGKASFLSAYKGGNSQEYLDLINQEREDQATLNNIGEGIYNPPSLEGKVIAGATAGLVSLPRFLIAGRLFGGAGLPLMTYAEHLHRGNREAALSALPMAILAGAMHGAGEFYSGLGKPKEVSYLDDEGNVQTRTYYPKEDGTAAPTSRVTRTPGKFTKEDLSLFTEKIAKGPEVSIRNLSPIERQLVLRGANALALTGTSLATNPHQSTSDLLSSLVVGLTYPVGKGPKAAEFAEYTGEPFRPVNVRGTGLLTGQGLPDLSQQLEQMRVDVPLTPAPVYGKFPIIEQERGIKPVLYPPAETPDVAKYAPLKPDGTRDISNPLGYVAETETGFQARGQGQTLHLDLDTANLNLLDLKRSLEDGSYKKAGDDTKTILQKQQAIKNAIATLEAAIPEETKVFFEKNEDVIRTALRTNYEATQGKSEFIKRRAESIKPEEVQPNQQELKPLVTGEESPQEIFGDSGVANEGTNQEGAKKFVSDLFKITTMGQRGSLSNKPLEGKGIYQQTKDELNYLSAFFIEDLYKRGVVPTVDAIANKIKVVAGDAARNLSDEQLKKSFKAGMDFYAANNADPFFSRMKQDAAEKLPKKFTEEQARNILAQHVDEFQWTTGLQEFLDKNKGQKINKQDLIDVINRGQVKVEESVAQENDDRIAIINSELESINQRLNRIARDADIQAKGDTKLGDELYVNNEEKRALDNRYLELKKEKATLNSNRPKYSLKAYTYEKLELPGAENSREVKLISPSMEFPYDSNYHIYDPATGETIGFATNEADALSRIEGTRYDYESLFDAKLKYKSPHWDEPNVVAHYRTSDRNTTDGQRMLFSEEFQSDWNHDIRERGVIKTKEQLEELRARGRELNNRLEDINESNPYSEEYWKAYSEWEKVANEINRKGIEPNPFMQHSWKELVMKRFLRDAVVAKDERFPYKIETYQDKYGLTYYSLRDKNGVEVNEHPIISEQELNNFLKENNINLDSPYKYDAIGWTTARQQMERYGKILEGKEFKWQKNADGTYTFGLKRTGNEGHIGWEEFHELRNISLERFAELTTPEAAQEVRDQEAKQKYAVHVPNGDFFESFPTLEEARKRADTLTFDNPENVLRWNRKYHVDDNKNYMQGQFSLKDAVELRKEGEEKYDDYDTALVNIAKKIGKRFGAKYSTKEIETQSARNATWGKFLEDHGVENIYDTDSYDYEGLSREFDKLMDKETVHSLEITPSMRQSLEKEGLPLYGLGGQEPLKSPEVGIRNQLTTIEGFNQHRDLLVKSLAEATQEPTDVLYPEERQKFQQAIAEANREDIENFQLLIDARKSNVFNSGLNPDALIDQVKLLYSGIQDFKTFSIELVKRFGEQVKPFLQDLWLQAKGLTKNFNEDERGFLNLGKKDTLAKQKFDEEDHPIRRKLYWLHRGVMLAQLNDEAGDVYNVARVGQRDKNFFLTSVYGSMRDANKIIASHHEEDVAKNISIGNFVEHKLYDTTELAAGDATTGRPALNTEQIQAYNDVYKAEHTVLDKRLQHVLYGFRERAQAITDKLANTTNPATINNLNTQLLDIADAMRQATAHFDKLKNEGYISTKRKGPIAAFVHDPAFPVGDERGKIYDQFDSVKEANAWIAEQEQKYGANPNLSNLYRLQIPADLRAAANKLTPAQFEELVDTSGVNPKDPNVEQLRDEIYTRYPSAGYELKRDNVRGYDDSWKGILESIADQTEAYANSFYSRVVGEHMIKALNATSLQKTNFDLYQMMQRYIDHEISSPEQSTSAHLLSLARKATYMYQLGGDVNQLYLNAIAQPVTQTYSYFARVQHDGKMLGLGEPEKYWIKGWKLAKDIGFDNVDMKFRNKARSRAPQEFADIYDQLKAEGVISAEFNKSLIEREADKTLEARLQKKSIYRTIEHWSGGFMRAGEITTRTHAAAEAYLVGKEKFELSGTDLTNFIVRAVDATQSNPSRAEAPLIVRGEHNTSEVRKSIYQFNAFNHMWIENLALNVKSDLENRNILKSATARHIAPVVIIGGLSGVPLAGLMGALAQLITGEDPKKKFHELTKSVPYLERLALYGITTNATLSNKLTPSVPFVEDTLKDAFLSDKTWSEILITSKIPAITTAGQFQAGVRDLWKGNYLRGAGEIIPVRPIRNAFTTIRYAKEGVRARGGASIVPKSKISPYTLLEQGIGISPSAMTEFYDNKTHTGQVDLVRKVRNEIVRKVKKL